MFEQVTDYKSACIANGDKPWIPVYQQNKPIKTWYSWWYINWNKIKDGYLAGLFDLNSSIGVSYSGAFVGTHLRFISKNAAEYTARTFKPLYMKHIFGID